MGIVLRWTNPTGHKNSPDAYSGALHKGYVIRIDSTKEIPLPVQWGTSFDLATLPEVQELTAGAHHVELAVINQEGQKSAYAPAGSFPVPRVPNPPGNLSIS